MTSLSDHAEQFLAVEFENAAIDARGLTPPNAQLMAEVPQYRQQWIDSALAFNGELLAEVEQLKAQLAELQGRVELDHTNPGQYFAFGWCDHEGGNSSWIDDEPF